MESETEAAGSDSEEEEEEEEEEEDSDEDVRQEDDGEEMEAVTSSVKMLETAESGVTIESCVTSADNAGDAVGRVTSGDDAVDSVTSGDDADTCRTCVETQWKNSTAILNGEELIELFKAIHTGKKVLEGLTTIGLVGSWLFISCVHPFTSYGEESARWAHYNWSGGFLVVYFMCSSFHKDCHRSTIVDAWSSSFPPLAVPCSISLMGFSIMCMYHICVV